MNLARNMLRGLITAAGAEVVDLGVLPDDAVTVRQRLAETAAAYDVIITSGGASRGEEDHLATALDALGKRHLWQLAIKPGRPMARRQHHRPALAGRHLMQLGIVAGDPDLRQPPKRP